MSAGGQCSGVRWAATPRTDRPRDRNWPKDEFGRSEIFSQFSFLWLIAIALGTAALVFLLSNLFGQRGLEVVAYCAQDQEYAEPIFREFERESRINVRAVYDSEAVKTVGLANRLLAERQHPQCDVFWGNEELRARQLAAQHVFRPTNGWAAFGYRSRRMVINTHFVALPGPAAGPAKEGTKAVPMAPGSLLQLTNASWRGKIALAYPQFGTTATHFHALRQHWGEAAWEAWCRALAANQPLLVDGNSVVVKMVGSGEAWVGLTDSDDIAAGQREGLPVAPLPMNAETLLIPNTVGVIRGAPHPAAAERLYGYLRQPEIAGRLVTARALEGIAPNVAPAPGLKVNWDALLRDLEQATAKLNQIFLR